MEKEHKNHFMMWFFGINYIELFHFMWYMTFSHMATGAQVVKMLLEPVTIIFFISYFAIWYFVEIKVIDKIKELTLNPEKESFCSALYRFICLANIFVSCIVQGIVYPYILNIAARNTDVTTFNFLSAVCVTFGSTLLFGETSEIFWLDDIEQIFDKVPLKKSGIVISQMTKNLVVGTLTVIGSTLISISPLLNPLNHNLDIYTLAFKKMIPMAMFGVIFAVICYTAISVSTRKKLNLVSDYVQKLADGDYTCDLLVVKSRDEFGLLTNIVNDFTKNTKFLLESISKTLTESTKAASDTTNSMENVSSSTSQIVTNIESVKNQVQNQNTGMSNASRAVNEIMTSINELTDSVEQQSAGVEESSAAVREMVANIQSVTNILNKNAELVHKLEGASEIGKKNVQDSVELSKTILEESSGLMEASSVIQNIAEQTNLLAMNAAIEAAHAGESGKGFSVVAEEIRKLAEQSNTQGKAISTRLNDLQQIILKVSDSSKVLQSQFNEIFNLTKNVQQQENVVVDAMKEQSEGSNQILLAMKNIDDTTIHVKHDSDVIFEGGNKVADEVGKLGSVTQQITKAISEMSSGTDMIINSVQEGNEASKNNSQSINKLTVNINKFKL